MFFKSGLSECHRKVHRTTMNDRIITITMNCELTYSLGYGYSVRSHALNVTYIVKIGLLASLAITSSSAEGAMSRGRVGRWVFFAIARIYRYSVGTTSRVGDHSEHGSARCSMAVWGLCPSSVVQG